MNKRPLVNAFISLAGLFFLSTAIFIGCKKNDSSFNNAAPPDLVTKIKSSVSGFVTDENNSAVKNASVQFGTTTILTDKYGYFEAKDIDVIKDAATVTVTRTGYFKGIKTFIATAGKAAFFRIKLIPKTIAGTVNGSSGGTVTLSNGLSVTLPVNGIINTTTNTTYTGTVNVAAYWINPVSNELPQIMPGDLRGVNTEGNVQLLTTYGMAAVELTGSGGELLQIAAGKKATLSTPIPSSILSSAPATIPLWYFDESIGLWKEEGSATKNGNNYVGEVSHFSFWNYDLPNACVPFSCTVLNSVGQPIQNAFIKISLVSNPASYGYGYTDASGFLSGVVTANAQLLFEVNAISCNIPVYTQTFTTTFIPVSLGNIIVPSTSTSTVTGSVTNCNNNPVTNGDVYVLENNMYTRYSLNNIGIFSFPKILCSNTTNIILVAEDNSTLQQSSSLNLTLVPGNNAVGNLVACGISSEEYFYYTMDGISYLMTAPQDSILLRGNGTVEGNIFAQEKAGGNHLVDIVFRSTGITLNSNQQINEFYSSKVPAFALIPTTSVTFVHVTEYGPVGQFVAATFSGVFAERSNGSATHIISGTFRARRH